MAWPLGGRTHTMWDSYKEAIHLVGFHRSSLSSFYSYLLESCPPFSATMMPSKWFVKHLVKERMAIIRGESSSKRARTIELE